MADIHLAETSLPVGGQELISTRWWGMMCLIATEGILFVYLIFAYAYLGSQSPGPWPPAGPPSLALSAPDTIVLVASSFLLGWGARRGANKARLRLALGGTFVLGTIFLVVQGFEWAAKPFTLKTNAYSAIYFTLTGFHMAHVVVGLLMLLVLLGGRSAAVSTVIPNAPSWALFIGTLSTSFGSRFSPRSIYFRGSHDFAAPPDPGLPSVTASPHGFAVALERGAVCSADRLVRATQYLRAAGNEAVFRYFRGLRLLVGHERIGRRRSGGVADCAAGIVGGGAKLEFVAIRSWRRLPQRADPWSRADPVFGSGRADS